MRIATNERGARERAVGAIRANVGKLFRSEDAARGWGALLEALARGEYVEGTEGGGGGGGGGGGDAGTLA